ncbi:hypothetical protein QP136_22915 [Escherichia coli]|nr:hypothetical protein [Escherichia coli]MDK7085377.1 hypothetical protein [Gardnerella leopoldii]
MLLKTTLNLITLNKIDTSDWALVLDDEGNTKLKNGKKIYRLTSRAKAILTDGNKLIIDNVKSFTPLTLEPGQCVVTCVVTPYVVGAFIKYSAVIEESN